MRIPHLMGLGFLWIWCTAISLLFPDVVRLSPGVNVNWLTGYNVSSVATIFNIILVPVAFFVHGIPRLSFLITLLLRCPDNSAVDITRDLWHGTVYALFQDSRGWSMGWLSKF